MTNKQDIILKKLFKLFEQKVEEGSKGQDEVLYGLIRYCEKEVGNQIGQMLLSLNVSFRRRMALIHETKPKHSLAVDLLDADGLRHPPNGMTYMERFEVPTAKDVWLDTTTYRMAEYIDSTLTWQYQDAKFILLAYSWNPETDDPTEVFSHKLTALPLDRLVRELLETNTITVNQQ